MELTDENLDYPDCGNPDRETSIKLSPKQEERFAKREAERAAELAAQRSAKRTGPAE